MSEHFLSVALQKRELRERYRQLRHDIDPAEKKRMDEAILQRVLDLPEYLEAELVLCYVSMAREPDTYGLMRAAWRDDKRVAVPRMAEGRKMEFYEITSHRALVPQSYGILEPDPRRSILLESFGEALCVVPGLVFDRTGYRLGYGGGYYDRFLAEFPGVSVGLCYELCLVDELVRDDHDRPCDVVVSDADSIHKG